MTNADRSKNSHTAGTTSRPSEKVSLQRIEIAEKDVLEHIFASGPVHSFARDGTKWFYSNDLCGALEIANPRDAISRLEPDEKGVAITDTRGGPQEVNVVNESGMYALIFSSRKPQAKAFRRWVTSEVLPVLRQTGSYSVGSTAPEGPTFDLTKAARYVVTVFPNEPTHIRETPLDAMLDEWSAFDTDILASHIRTVHALWQKTQLMRSIGGDPAGSPLYDRLGATILEGRRLADEYLRHVAIRPD
jgi:prophage antirepressor-like protein